MMSGYWNNKNLTNKSLFKETIREGVEKVFYRTGDEVREDENDNLIFLGRIDRQIKLRGYRIELDEIEAVLEQVDDVAEASSCVLENTSSKQTLTAAVILMPNAQKTIDELKAHCKSQLPNYAVPDQIHVLDEFPRTSSGKIDLTKIKSKLIAL